MIEIEHKKNGEMNVTMSGDMRTIWGELLEGVRHLHKVNSKVLGESMADTITDSLAFLGKLADEEFVGTGGELLNKFLAEKNSNN